MSGLYGLKVRVDERAQEARGERHRPQLAVAAVVQHLDVALAHGDRRVPPVAHDTGAAGVIGVTVAEHDQREVAGLDAQAIESPSSTSSIHRRFPSRTGSAFDRRSRMRWRSPGRASARAASPGSPASWSPGSGRTRAAPALPTPPHSKSSPHARAFLTTKEDTMKETKRSVVAGSICAGAAIALTLVSLALTAGARRRPQRPQRREFDLLRHRAVARRSLRPVRLSERGREAASGSSSRSRSARSRARARWIRICSTACSCRRARGSTRA